MVGLQRTMNIPEMELYIQLDVWKGNRGYGDVIQVAAKVRVISVNRNTNRPKRPLRDGLRHASRLRHHMFGITTDTRCISGQCVKKLDIS